MLLKKGTLFPERGTWFEEDLLFKTPGPPFGKQGIRSGNRVPFPVLQKRGPLLKKKQKKTGPLFGKQGPTFGKLGPTFGKLSILPIWRDF